jgi:hypothetical protein
MLISATHTHSAPSVWGALGSRVDSEYSEFLAPQIARGIELAANNLEPARVGWAVAKDFEHTHCRRWIFRSDRIRTDPFGVQTVRAHMHPGYQNPDTVGPCGPVDPDLSMLSVQSRDGRPIALLANYAMHYFGSPLVSADCFGRFAEKFTQRIGAHKADPPFVGILSQGTSGDQMWMDYGQPQKKISLDEYSDGLARIAHDAYGQITHQDWVPLAMRETKLTLQRRTPNDERLAWARAIDADIKDRLPRGLPEIYAREQILLHENPTAELKLQALRVGELGIAAIPNEVFGITGLKLKAHSPLVPTFNIELANGAEGYIPPPEQHKLGGYTTWPARSAGLEVEAEPRIVEALLGLLEEISGKPRRKPVEPHGQYSKAVLASKPLAYWRLGEFTGPAAVDSSGHNHAAAYEDLIAFHLDGPAAAFSGHDTINRCAHFAGGRLRASLKGLANTYSVELWFWNGMPPDARPVTGHLFSRGQDGASGAPGDHLGIGGTASGTGKLLFHNGNKLNQLLIGKTELGLKSWNHVVLVRDGENLTVYLNGNAEPEILGVASPGYAPSIEQLFVGGRNDNFANFEGKIDEVAVYNRALAPDEIIQHFVASQ